LNTWCKFLDSLSSRGGAILLLIMTSSALGVGVIHVLHHGDSGEGASLIRSTFAGFVGALLLALKTTGDIPRNSLIQNHPAPSSQNATTQKQEL